MLNKIQSVTFHVFAFLKILWEKSCEAEQLLCVALGNPFFGNTCVGREGVCIDKGWEPVLKLKWLYNPVI